MPAPELLELAAAVGKAWEANTVQLKRRARREGVRDYLYASSLRDCARQMALDLLHPEDEPEFDPDVLERFIRGDEVETSIVARLHRVGQLCDPPFRVEGGQREVEIRSRTGRVLIRGRIEGTINFSTLGTRIDFEVKSGRSVERAEGLDDLLRGNWSRGYVRQFLAYLYGELKGGRGNGLGLFVVDRPGLPVLVPVDLSEDRLLDLAEETLQAAEAAVEARHGTGPLPDFIADRGVCRRCCHLGKSCHPPIDFGAGATIDDDPEWEAIVQEYIDTGEPHRAHERAKTALFGDKKKPGRYRDRPLVIVGGRFLVEGKATSYTSYDVPKEVKEQYKRVDPEGSWKTAVTQIASDAKD